MTSAGRVLVTGGAGYVGAALVPRLLDDGFDVRVLDLFLYGDDVLAPHPRLTCVKGDIRDRHLVEAVVDGCDAVIHLACISNDPSFELDPALGRAINLDAFEPLVDASVRAGVSRFVYASSSSVYGVSEAADVTEEHPLRPLTDYSRFKRDCEPIVLSRRSASFAPVVIRPATVCGYSPRLRLDLTVNILTAHAIVNRRVTVFGGAQLRPNLHIDDMVALYRMLLALPREQIAGGVYNAGWQNHSVAAIAEDVRRVVTEELPDGPSIEVVTTPSDDLRSYHVSSEKIRSALGFAPARTIEGAVRDLCAAFFAGKVPRPLTDDRYSNVKRMQRLRLA